MLAVCANGLQNAYFLGFIGKSRRMDVPPRPRYPFPPTPGEKFDCEKKKTGAREGHVTGMRLSLLIKKDGVSSAKRRGQHTAEPERSGARAAVGLSSKLIPARAGLVPFNRDITTQTRLCAATL